MEYRRFGSTDLTVSVIGFGAWAIGGPAMAGNIPIGWGDQDDEISRKAIHRALEKGITFFDTADFYGLGHSEVLIGEELGKNKDVVIATKVGHRLQDDGSIALDYSKRHILEACEQSLKRLNRDVIDFYQLHSARTSHLERGECIEAMERLVEKGNIRYWGLSLNTFEPHAEAGMLMTQGLGHGFQLVLNILNRRAGDISIKAGKAGRGIIARMPLQFGLLGGAFTPHKTFAKDDHRSFRLTPEIIRETNSLLSPVWEKAKEHNVTPTQVALSYLVDHGGVSTVIPGIRTPEQADLNATGSDALPDEVRQALDGIDAGACERLTAMMQDQG